MKELEQGTVESSELVEATLNFWFADNEHIRTPFPEYIRPQLKEVATTKFYEWVSTLNSKAKDEVNDEIIAAHLGYKDEEKMFYIFPTFNKKYQNYSPGNILLMYLITNFFEEGGIKFDFTIGNEEYKKKLSNNISDIFYKNIALTFKGRLILPILLLKDYLKNFKLITYLVKLSRI